jgi:hypothetical protein
LQYVSSYLSKEASFELQQALGRLFTDLVLREDETITVESVSTSSGINSVDIEVIVEQGRIMVLLQVHPDNEDFSIELRLSRVAGEGLAFALDRIALIWEEED